MGWTVGNRPKLVCDPIDGQDARRGLNNKIARLDNKIARLAQGLKAERVADPPRADRDTIPETDETTDVARN